jgi:hypothetical protein
MLMRVFCTGLVLLALVGFAAPQAMVGHCRCTQSADGVCCCSHKNSEKIEDAAQTGQAAFENARPSKSCCGTGRASAPLADQSASTPIAPAEQKSPDEAPQSTPDSTCCHTCGVICCAKIVTLTRAGSPYLVPAATELLVAPGDSIPSSLTLSGIFRPPRSV